MDFIEQFKWEKTFNIFINITGKLSYYTDKMTVETFENIPQLTELPTNYCSNEFDFVGLNISESLNYLRHLQEFYCLKSLFIIKYD